MAQESRNPSTLSQISRPSATEPLPRLEWSTDHYRGAKVSIAANSHVSKELAPAVLNEAIREWAEVEQVHGVWIKVENEYAYWVPLLIERGFDFHHAQPGYVMLTRWLPKHRPSSLPRYAFTYVGVGGIVQNAKGDFLMIRERRGVYLGWKFPGGMMDPGENIGETAEREVFEETGVKSKYITVILMRHARNLAQGFAGTGDFYFVCAMKPINEAEVTPNRCLRETSACEWKSLSEIRALKSSEFHPFNQRLLDTYLEWKNTGSAGFKSHIFEIKEWKRQWTVYTTGDDFSSKDEDRPSL